MPYAGIRQPVQQWPGEEGQHAKPGGGGKGKGQGGGGRGELTGGYKYPPEPDDHTVSQLETDGSALAGHLATLAP